MANGFGGFGSDPGVSLTDPRSTSNVGVAFITSPRFDRFEPNAYDDRFGNWTIGFGFTRGVRPGDTMTREQALARMATELVDYEDIVKDKIDAPLSQGMFDALVDMAYNMGYVPDTMAEHLNAGRYDEAVEVFGRYTGARDQATGRMEYPAGLKARAAGREALFEGRPLEALQHGQHPNPEAVLGAPLPRARPHPPTNPRPRPDLSFSRAQVPGFQETPPALGPSFQSQFAPTPGVTPGQAAINTITGRQQTPQVAGVLDQPGFTPDAFAQAPPQAAQELGLFDPNPSLGFASQIGATGRDFDPALDATMAQVASGFDPSRDQVDLRDVANIAGMGFGATAIDPSGFSPVSGREAFDFGRTAEARTSTSHPDIDTARLSAAGLFSGEPDPAAQAFGPPTQTFAGERGPIGMVGPALGEFAGALDRSTAQAGPMGLSPEAAGAVSLNEPIALGLGQAEALGLAPEAVGSLDMGAPSALGVGRAEAMGLGPASRGGIDLSGPAGIQGTAQAASAPNIDAPSGFDIGMGGIGSGVDASGFMDPAASAAAGRAGRSVANLGDFAAARHDISPTMDPAVGIPNAQTLSSLGLPSEPATPSITSSAQAAPSSPFSGSATPAELEPGIDFTGLPSGIGAMAQGVMGVPNADFSTSPQVAGVLDTPGFAPDVSSNFGTFSLTPSAQQKDAVQSAAPAPSDVAFAPADVDALQAVFGLPTVSPEPQQKDMPTVSRPDPEPVATPEAVMDIAAPAIAAQPSAPAPEPQTPQTTMAPVPGPQQFDPARAFATPAQMQTQPATAAQFSPSPAMGGFGLGFGGLDAAFGQAGTSAGNFAVNQGLQNAIAMQSMGAPMSTQFDAFWGGVNQSLPGTGWAAETAIAQASHQAGKAAQAGGFAQSVSGGFGGIAGLDESLGGLGGGLGGLGGGRGGTSSSGGGFSGGIAGGPGSTGHTGYNP